MTRQIIKIRVPKILLSKWSEYYLTSLVICVNIFLNLTPKFNPARVALAARDINFRIVACLNFNLLILRQRFHILILP